MPIIDVTAKLSWLFVLRGVVLAGAVLALGGCGAGDIQYNGKIFDAIGMNNTAAKKTPKLAPRSGLVTPPSLERLPPPGSAPAAAQGDALAAINDPDRQTVESAESLARRQAEYCEKHYEPAVARGDASAEGIEGPAGPCRRSVFSAVKNWTKQD